MNKAKQKAKSNRQSQWEIKNQIKWEREKERGESHTLSFHNFISVFTFLFHSSDKERETKTERD